MKSQPQELDARGRSDSAPYPTLTRRACDQCHRRKVKCDGKTPCETCCRTEATCTYQKPVLPKGPIPRGNGEGPIKRKRVDDSQIDPTTHRANEPVATSAIIDWLNVGGSVPAPITDQDQVSGVRDIGALSPYRPGLHLVTSPNSLENFFADTSPFQEWQFPSSTYLPALPEPLLHFPNAPGPSRPLIAPVEDISPILTLSLDTLIRPQLDIFLDRIQPMIPIYTSNEINSRLSNPTSLQSPTFVAMILCMAALSLVHPLRPDELPKRDQRAKQAKVLMDEACRLRAGWDHGCDPCCEGVLASYLMFGTLFELGEAAGSRLRLKEAVTMGEAMQLDLPFSYTALNPVESARRRRLFFVLAVTERAFALQRSGHLIFHRPFHDQTFEPDPTATSLPFLAQLFSLIDQPLVYCWNNQCDPMTCTTLTRERAVALLSRLSGSATAVFGTHANASLALLGEVQKADLLITWQWLRNRIWRLALKHGLTEEGVEPELSVNHPIGIAATTIAICKRLSSLSMEAHGTGFVEKLYDIASIITDIAKGSTRDNTLPQSQAEKWGEMLTVLHSFVSVHRSGRVFAGYLGDGLNVVNNVRLLTAA